MRYLVVAVGLGGYRCSTSIASESLWAEIVLKSFGLRQELRSNKLRDLTGLTQHHLMPEQPHFFINLCISLLKQMEKPWTGPCRPVDHHRKVGVQIATMMVQVHPYESSAYALSELFMAGGIESHVTSWKAWYISKHTGTCDISQSRGRKTDTWPFINIVY